MSSFEGITPQSGATENQRLADQGYWNEIYDRTGRQPDPRTARGGLRRVVAALLPPTVATVLRRGYAQHLIDTVAMAPAFPVQPEWRAIEVGSAPGHHLIDLHRRFGYAPYGVEYTNAGVEANRRLFADHGIDPDQVLHSDFFAEEFRRTYQGQFDVVISIGFIEHFADVHDVVDRHVELLRDGGRLLVVIPNLRGINRLLARMAHPGLIDIHNTAIMDVHRFTVLFDAQPLRPVFKGYLGVFSLRLLNTRPESRRRHLLPIAWRVGQLIDLGIVALLRGRHPESRWFSPYLVFAGEKRADVADG